MRLFIVVIFCPEKAPNFTCSHLDFKNFPADKPWAYMGGEGKGNVEEGD